MSDLLVILIILLIIVLVWRGPKTLPELGRMFGRGVREARAEARRMGSDGEAPRDDEDSTRA